MAGKGIAVKASVVVRTKKGAKFPAGSYAAALSPARAALKRDAERAFATQSDPVTGRKWAPRKGAYPWAPLLKTGELKGAAIEAAENATLTGSSLTATVKTRYAGFQQKGTRTIAARRFVGASIGTIAVVRAGLRREGKRQAVRVLRGK